MATYPPRPHRLFLKRLLVKGHLCGVLTRSYYFSDTKVMFITWDMRGCEAVIDQQGCREAIYHVARALDRRWGDWRKVKRLTTERCEAINSLRNFLGESYERWGGSYLWQKA